MSKQLYLDEGYVTGNEKNYEILESIEDDSDEWDVDTDNDPNEEKYEDENPNGTKSPPLPPVRNQIASQANTSTHSRVVPNNNSIESVAYHLHF